MEPKQINQLMLAMGRTGITKLILKKEGVELHLEREEKTPLRAFEGTLEDLEEMSVRQNPMHQEIESHRRSAAVAETRVLTKSEDEKEDVNVVYITSPMVGTIYYAPSPNDPSFVKPGDRVEKSTVVCIIEAMKVMNEVKAGMNGIISEPLVENGHPVEFGTKLFKIVPA
jgi:acetyl-CoA carboxylase biotin carboxyl carrier protein